MRSSLTKSFCLGCPGSFFSHRGHPSESHLDAHTYTFLFLLLSYFASILLLNERTSEQASNSSIPPALSSVPLHATNGLWIASSFCRATSFTREFSFYPRVTSSFAHRATVKINLSGSLIAVKSERTWMTFQNLSKITTAHVILADFIDYCLFLLPIDLAFYKYLREKLIFNYIFFFLIEKIEQRIFKKYKNWKYYYSCVKNFN